MAVKKLLIKLDISRPICNHLIGARHTIIHRRIAGMIIMYTGITIIHAGEHMYVFVRLLIESFGAGIHGVGLIPFIDSLDSKPEDETDKTKEDPDQI